MVSLLSQEGSSNAQSKTNRPAVTPGHHSHFHHRLDEKVSFQATAKYLSKPLFLQDKEIGFARSLLDDFAL